MTNATVSHATVRQTSVSYKTYAHDDNAFACVTEWGNGEGYDVDLNEKGCQAFFQMTRQQWMALQKAMKRHAAYEFDEATQ